MALNYLFIFFFLIAFVIGLARLLFTGDTEVFSLMVNATFDSAKTGFEISLGLTGVLTLWMGIMKVGEKGVWSGFLPGPSGRSSTSCFRLWGRTTRPMDRLS